MVALEAGIDPAAIVDMFLAYAKAEGRVITRAIFEENLDGKLRLPALRRGEMDRQIELTSL